MHKLLHRAQKKRKETSRHKAARRVAWGELTKRDYAVVAFTEWPNARRLLFPRHVGAGSEAWDGYGPRSTRALEDEGRGVGKRRWHFHYDRAQIYVHVLSSKIRQEFASLP